MLESTNGQQPTPPPMPSFLGGRIHRASQQYADDFAAAVGTLTLTQFMVLLAVSEHQPCSQTALVNSTGIDRSTLADVVRRLVKRKLLTRHRTKEDARAYAVKLTDDGKHLLSDAKKAVRSLERQWGTKIEEYFAPARQEMSSSLQRA